LPGAVQGARLRDRAEVVEASAQLPRDRTRHPDSSSNRRFTRVR
jgi:hypothetical protein